MSLGHSDCTHYLNPGIKTDNVEEFIQAAKQAGSVKIIPCAKAYEEQHKEWREAMKSNRKGSLPDRDEEPDGLEN